MKQIIILSIFLYSSFGYCRSSKRFLLEPTVGYNQVRWRQSINSEAISGRVGGNSIDLTYGVNLFYAYTKKWVLGLGYKGALVNWMYSDSDDYSEDNGWPNNTKGSSQDLCFLVGTSVKKFNFIYAYHFKSTLTFPDYYLDSLDEVEYYGTGHSFKFVFLKKKKYTVGALIGQTVYNKGKFNGKKVTLTDEVGAITFKKMTTEYVGIEVTYPIGPF